MLRKRKATKRPNCKRNLSSLFLWFGIYESARERANENPIIIQHRRFLCFFHPVSMFSVLFFSLTAIQFRLRLTQCDFFLLFSLFFLFNFFVMFILFVSCVLCLAVVLWRAHMIALQMALFLFCMCECLFSFSLCNTFWCGNIVCNKDTGTMEPKCSKERKIKEKWNEMKRANVGINEWMSNVEVEVRRRWWKFVDAELCEVIVKVVNTLDGTYIFIKESVASVSVCLCILYHHFTMTLTRASITSILNPRRQLQLLTCFYRLPMCISYFQISKLSNSMEINGTNMIFYIFFLLL